MRFHTQIKHKCGSYPQPDGYSGPKGGQTRVADAKESKPSCDTFLGCESFDLGRSVFLSSSLGRSRNCHVCLQCEALRMEAVRWVETQGVVQDSGGHTSRLRQLT